jgi:hypothetical protein
MSRSTRLSMLLGLVSYTVAIVIEPRASGLNQLATGIGKLYFGTATDNPELTDAPYVAILDQNTMFGQITAANSMKWVSNVSSHALH